MNIGNIQGGTHAGWRRVKQTKQVPWECPCRKHSKFEARCTRCGATQA